MNHRSLAAFKNIHRIASSLSDDALSGELKRSAYKLVAQSRVAVINPEAKKFEERLREVVDELEAADEEIDSIIQAQENREDQEKLSRMFEQLDLPVTEKLLTTGGSRTAGIGDWIKKLFGESDDEEISDIISDAQYSLSEDEIDDFIDSGEWGAVETFIEKEKYQLDHFMAGVADILDELESTRKLVKKGENIHPSWLESLSKELKKLISKGSQLIKGIFDKPPSIEMVEEGLGEEKKKGEPAKEKKTKAIDVPSTAEHYADMIKENIDDEGKLKSIFRELFDTIGPWIKDDRAEISLASFVKYAYSHPESRHGLIPIIRVAQKLNISRNQLGCANCGSPKGYDRTYCRCVSCGKPWFVGGTGNHFHTGRPPP